MNPNMNQNADIEMAYPQVPPQYYQAPIVPPQVHIQVPVPVAHEENKLTNYIFVLILIYHFVNLYNNYVDYNTIETYEVLFILLGINTSTLLAYLAILIIFDIILIVIDFKQLHNTVSRTVRKYYIIMETIHMILSFIIIYNIKKLVDEYDIDWNPTSHYIFAGLSIFIIMYNTKLNNETE